jgi:hypothetical protein
VEKLTDKVTGSGNAPTFPADWGQNPLDKYIEDAIMEADVSKRILSGELDDYLAQFAPKFGIALGPKKPTPEIRGDYRSLEQIMGGPVIRGGSVLRERTVPSATPGTTMPPRGGYKGLGDLRSGERTIKEWVQPGPEQLRPERLDFRSEEQILDESVPIGHLLFNNEGIHKLAMLNLQGQGISKWLGEGAFTGITGLTREEIAKAVFGEEKAEEWLQREKDYTRNVVGYDPVQAKKLFENVGEISGDLATIAVLGVPAGAATAAISRPIVRGMARGALLGAMHAVTERPEDDSVLNRLKQIPGEAMFFSALDAGIVTFSQVAKIIKWHNKYGNWKPSENFMRGKVEYPGKWEAKGATADDVKAAFRKMEMKSAGTQVEITESDRFIYSVFRDMSPQDKANFLRFGGIAETRPTYRADMEIRPGGSIPRRPKMGDIFKRVDERGVPLGESATETYPGETRFGEAEEISREARGRPSEGPFNRKGTVPTRPGSTPGGVATEPEASGFRKLLASPEGGPDIYIHPQRLWERAARSITPKQTPRLSPPLKGLPSPSQNTYFADGTPIRTRLPRSVIEEHADLGSKQAQEALAFIKQHEGEVQFAGKYSEGETITGKAEEGPTGKDLVEQHRREKELEKQQEKLRPRWRGYKNPLYQAVHEITSGRGIRPNQDYPYSDLQALKLPVGFISKKGMAMDDIAAHFNSEAAGTARGWLRVTGNVGDNDLYKALGNVRDRREAGLAITEDAMEGVAPDPRYDDLTPEEAEAMAEEIGEGPEYLLEEEAAAPNRYPEAYEEDLEPPRESAAAVWPDDISDHFRVMAVEDFKSLEAMANAGVKEAQKTIDFIRESGEIPGVTSVKRKAATEPEVEFKEAGEGAMQHGRGDVSAEEIQRQKTISFYKWRPKSDQPPVKIPGSGAVDVPAGKSEIKFQINKNTGKMTLLDKGPGTEGVTGADVDKLKPFVEEELKTRPATTPPEKTKPPEEPELVKPEEGEPPPEKEPKPQKETDLFGKEESKPKEKRPVKEKEPKQRSFYDVAGVEKDKIARDFADAFPDEAADLTWPAPFGNNKQMTFNSPRAFQNQVQPAVEKGYKITYDVDAESGRVNAEISGKPGGEGRLVSKSKSTKLKDLQDKQTKKTKAKGKQDKFDFSGQPSLADDPNHLPMPPEGILPSEIPSWYRAYFAKGLPALFKKWRVPEEYHDKIMDDFLANYRYDRGDQVEAFLRDRLKRLALRGHTRTAEDEAERVDTTSEYDLNKMTTASDKKGEGPEDKFEKAELRSKAIDVIQGLKTTDKNKKYLHDYLFKGKRPARIAAENKATPNAVSKAIHRQLDRLSQESRDLIHDYIRSGLEYKHAGLGGPIGTKETGRIISEWWDKFSKGKETRMGRLREKRFEMIQGLHSEIFLGETYYKDIKNFVNKAGNKEQMREYVRMFLTGEADVELSALPDKMKNAITKARGHIDRLTKMIVLYGNLKPETERIFKHNMGSYLVGKYRAYIEPSWSPSKKVKNAFKDYLKRTVEDMADWTDEELENYITGIIEDTRQEGSPGKWGGRIPASVFKEKKDLPQEFKDLIGEVDDIAFIYFATIQKTAAGAYKARLLNEVADSYPDLWTPDETTAKKKGWQNYRLPDDRQYGRLRGTFVDRVVKEFIQEDLDHHYHWLERIMMRYIITPWKINRTIGSVPTHARNTIGNIFFSLLSGSTPANPMNWPYYRKAAAMLAQKGKHRETWKHLVEIGVVGNQFYGTEVPKFMGAMIEEPVDRWIFKFRNKAKDLGKKGLKKVANLYNAEDAVYRVAAFYKLKDKGYSDKQAVDELDRTFPNYLKLPGVVDVLRKYTILGPFVSFTFNVMKITACQFARAAGELEAGVGKGPPLSGPPPIGKAGKGHDGYRGGDKNNGGKGADPRLFFRGLTRLAALGAVLSGPYILSEASRIAAGVDKDFVKELDDFRPPWNRNRIRFYFRQKGKIKVLDLTYIHPWGTNLSAFRAALRGDISSMGEYLDFMTNPLLEVYQIGILNQDPERFNMPVGNWWDRGTRVIQNVFLPASAPVFDPVAAIQEGKLRPAKMTPSQIRKLLDAWWKQPTDMFGTVDKFSEEFVAFLAGLRTTEVEPLKILTRFAMGEAATARQLKKEHEQWWKNNHMSASASTILRKMKALHNAFAKLGERQKKYRKFREKYKDELGKKYTEDLDRTVRDFSETFEEFKRWRKEKEIKLKED